MTRLGNFSLETLAVDAMAAELDLLEGLAARGGTLDEYDLNLLAQCNARLSRMLQALAANAEIAEPRPIPSRNRPARVKKKRRRSLKMHHVYSL
ncbi:MAG: hypothetical protein ACR2OL_01775 [Anderseniella sp.]